MNDLWRRFTRGGRRPPGRGWFGGSWWYASAAALLLAVVAVVVVVAAVSGAGGGQHRGAAPVPATRGAGGVTALASPEPGTAASATPEGTAVALVVGFPGAIPVASATLAPAPFPTPPTLSGMPAAIAPGQPTPPPAPPPPPPAMPAGAAPPPGQPPAPATPPVANPPPSGIPTPPAVVVPPPPIVNPPAAAAPVVQNVVNAPAATDVMAEPPAQSAEALLLSVAVRAADRPDALVSPSVRVFANGEECAEATGIGAILVQVAVPDSCGQPGDLLSFEAGGLDSRAAAPSDPAPACPVELVFDAAGRPIPAYQPVQLAPGPRFVTLDLADLPGCPAPGAQPQPAGGDATTLTLTMLQNDTPGAPLERPTVTAYVGAVACARNTALAGRQVVLTLPAACGQPGAAVALRASALDVRYQRDGDAATCPIVPPPAGIAVPDFRPEPQPIVLQPGGALEAALLLGDCPTAALTAAPTPATPSGIASATVTPTPAVTPSGAAATAHADTATAAPTGTPVPPTASGSPTPAPSPTATPPPALSVPSVVPGGIIVPATPALR